MNYAELGFFVAVGILAVTAFSVYRVEIREIKIGGARSQPASPVDAAALGVALLAPRNSRRLPVEIRPVVTDGELEAVWELDDAGYGEAAEPFEMLVRWWCAFPEGVMVAYQEGRIVGAIGLWPISAEQAADFRQGRISEQELAVLDASVVESSRETGLAWYAAGIVVEPDSKHSLVVRDLLKVSLNSWLGKGYVRFPLDLLAIATSDSGRSLLERFSFSRERPGRLMPDHSPLYSLHVGSREHFRQILRDRNLSS